MLSKFSVPREPFVLSGSNPWSAKKSSGLILRMAPFGPKVSAVVIKGSRDVFRDVFAGSLVASLFKVPRLEIPSSDLP